LLVNEICRTHKKVIVAALRNPYDILEFSNISTYICAYEYTPMSVRSVLNIITGREKASGKLPVRIEGGAL
jgi:beta-N-acetylhexosaminidase